LAVAAATVVATMALAASSAAAAQRFASPSGSGSGCSSGSPCSIQTAFSGGGTGDEIIVTPGDYGPISSTLFAPPNGYVHGVHGQPAPRIHLAPGRFLDTQNPGARVSYLQVDGENQPLQVDESTEADQIYAHGTGGDACIVYGTLIDSVCWTASGDTAISGATNAGTTTPVLRNVTAESFGSGGVGIEYHTASSGQITVTAVNVIAHGTSTDVQAQADSPANTTINIDHSNFVTGLPLGSNGHINTTAPQGASPLFVNAAAGDFSEAAGSPTINAGVTSPANGAFDVLGLSRVIQGATDIGAYEYDPFAGVVIGKQKSKVKKRKAKVAIGCPAGTPTPCGGTLTLSYSQGKKTRTAGTASFSVEAGTTGKIKVKLSKRALKTLGKRHKLKLTASATATDGAGKTASSTGKVKLRG
jgi:hypothetical protein